jgi:leucine-rich repeat protein SHOC2
MLKISYNQIRELPDSFESLENLKTLDLYANKLTSLPKSLLKLKNLENLSLNPKLKKDSIVQSLSEAGVNVS